MDEWMDGQANRCIYSIYIYMDGWTDGYVGRQTE
jgi:hypothetical protein